MNFNFRYNGKKTYIYYDTIFYLNVLNPKTK